MVSEIWGSSARSSEVVPEYDIMRMVSFWTRSQFCAVHAERVWGTNRFDGAQISMKRIGRIQESCIHSQALECRFEFLPNLAALSNAGNDQLAAIVRRRCDLVDCL